jgi:hypothetical protein
MPQPIVILGLADHFSTSITRYPIASSASASASAGVSPLFSHALLHALCSTFNVYRGDKFTWLRVIVKDGE